MPAAICRFSVLSFALLAPLAALRAQSTYSTPYTFDTFAGISDLADDANGGNNSNTGTTDAIGTLARFNETRSVAVDSLGNIFVADFNNHTIRKITPSGSVSTFAGAAGVPDSTDAPSGPATDARFNNPIGLAIDSSDNIYVGDYGNNRIRKITPAGVVSTLAGSTSGFTDDNGTAAQFNGPHGVDVDTSGNVYVADTNNNVIRKITPAGGVSTLAGSLAGLANSTDAPSGPGTDARFNGPFAVAVDGSGNVFVADTLNHTIRKITSLGEVTTYAGAALDPGTLDATGTAARFNSPSDVELDSAGNLYVTDSGRTIRRITSIGAVTTLAGDASNAGSADGTGIGALFFFPSGVSADALGNLYIADSGNSTIRTQPAQTTALTINSSSVGTYGVGYPATVSPGGDGSGSLLWTLGTGSTAAGAAINSTTGAVTFTSPGTVVFHVTKLADADFHSQTTADFTLTVGKANQTALSVDSSPTGTFGTIYTASYTGGSGTGAISWSLGTGSTAPGAAINSSTGVIGSTGAGTVVINVTKATDVNYLVATSADFTVTLGKATQAALSVNSSPTGTFGAAYTASSTGGSGSGAVTYSLGTGSDAPGAAVSAGGSVTSTGAGTVVIKATKATDADYLAATSADFTITLGKATQAALSVNSSPTGTFGTAYAASSTGGSGSGAVTYSLGTGSDAPGAAVSAGGSVTSTGAGTVVIKATKATDADYLAATSADFTVTLGKATQAALSVNSSPTGTFGAAYAASSTGGSGSGAVTYSLGTGSDAPGAAVSAGGSVTSTGAGTVVIKATKATDADYLAATSADFTITLGKATQAALSVNSSPTGTFGTAYAASSTGGSGSGAVTYSLGTGSDAPGAAVSAGGSVTSTGAGTVVIKATKATDADYLAATSADFTVTLGKATQAVLSVNSSPTGTFGTAYAASSTGGSGSGAVTYSLGTGSDAPGAAVSAGGSVTSTGAGTVVIKATKATDADYLAATSADFTVTLGKATQAALSVNSSPTGTFGTAYTASSTGGSGSGAVTYSLGTGSDAPGAAVSAGGSVTSTGAGTVVIKATKATDADYLAATSADFTITLGKATQAVLSVNSSPTGTFGTAYAASSTGGSGGGAVTYSLGTGSDAPGAAVSAGGSVTSTGAGTVVIKATKATDADYLAATSADFTITLGKATQAALSVNSSPTGTFGTIYTASSTGGSGGGAITWSLGTGSTAPNPAVNSSSGVVSSTGAGTVVIKVTKATDTNYLAATSVDFTITLAKATQATLSVSSSATGTYLTAYTATSTGGSGTGAVTWSLGSGSTAPGAAISSGGAVTSTGAGTVVIKATKATDSDYLVATSSDFTVTLAKATQAVLSVSSSATGTYLTAYAATATGGSGTGAVTWSLGTGSTAPGAAISSGGAVTSTGAGTVVIKATKATDTNYLVATSADFTVTLAKATQASLSVNSSATGTYLTPYAATSTGGSGTGAVTWALGTGSTAPGAAISSGGAVTSTGAGTVVIKATKATDSDYLVATSSDFTVTLAKATQAALSVSSSATGTYLTAYAATSTGGSGTGAVTWSLGTGSTAPGAAITSGGAVTSTGTGTVVIKATKAADADYLVATSSDFTVTLAKAAQTITFAGPADQAFSSTPIALSASSNSGLTVAFSIVSGPATVTGSSLTLTGSGTIVIRAAQAGDSNYNPAADVDRTLSIGKAPQAAVTITSAATGTYGTAYTATATGGTGTGAIVWTLGAGSTATGAAINSSTGVVTFTSPGTVVFNAYRATDADYNASATTADFTLTVGKADQAAVNITSATTGSVGTPYTATATGGTGTGAIVWALGTGSTATGAAIDPATGVVTFTSTGTVVFNATRATDTNYAVSATTADFTVTIGTGTATVTLGSLAATFDGSAHAATATTVPASLAVTFTYNGSATVPTDAGTYAVIGTISDANYTGTASGSLVISKAVPVITWATPAGIQYGATLSSTELNATASVAGSFVYSPASGTMVNPGSQTLTVTFTPTDTANYTGATAQRTLTVTVDSRIPAGFDIAGYYARYPDVKATFGSDTYSAWLYYHDHGIYQGEVFDDEFRVEEYLALYPDLFAAFGSDLGAALDHWLSTGRIEGKLGRIPVSFSAAGYFARNPDVAAATNNNTVLAWQHFWLYGIYEGRAYDDEFRAFEYLAINADLTAAFVDDWRQATLHWMRYGRTEGRLGRIPLTFDVAEYLVRNPDVQAVFGTNPTTVFLHYWLFGLNEGRTYDDLFRVDEYLALNPDLATVFGSDRQGAFKHWVRYGQAEGRPGKNP